MRNVKISFSCCILSSAVLDHQKDFSLTKYISSFRAKLKRLNLSIVLLCKRPNVSVWLKDVDAKWSYERDPLRSNSNKPQVQFLYPVRPGDSYGKASVANKSVQTKRRLIKWGQRMRKLNSSLDCVTLATLSQIFLSISGFSWSSLLSLIYGTALTPIRNALCKPATGTYEYLHT